MKYIALILVFLNISYAMKEEKYPDIKSKFFQLKFDFLEFLKKKINKKEKESELLIDLENTDEKVIAFFKYYVVSFENHDFCAKKCCGEIPNEDREDYVIVSKNNLDSDETMVCFGKIPPGGHQESFFCFKSAHICDSITYEKKNYWFPVPVKNEDGEQVEYEDEYHQKVKVWEENKYDQKLCYIVHPSALQINHALCKKVSCINQNINADFKEYNVVQPCAMIGQHKTFANKCCFVLENKDLYDYNSSLFDFISVVANSNSEEKNIIIVDVKKLRGFLDDFNVIRKKSFFRQFKESAKNKKNIGVGVALGALTYVFFNKNKYRKIYAPLSGVSCYGMIVFGSTYHKYDKYLFSEEKDSKK